MRRRPRATQIVRNRASQESVRAAKLEAQLGIKLGGYQKRAQSLASQFAETVTQLDHARVELACFQELGQVEREGLVERLAKLEQEVARMQQELSLLVAQRVRAQFLVT